MNEFGRNALRAAALAGVKQIRGHLRDAAGGRCAFGVLEDASGGQDLRTFGLGSRRSRTLHRCPLCQSTRREWMLLLHLNDHHGCDFFKLAELMPVSPGIAMSFTLRDAVTLLATLVVMAVLVAVLVALFAGIGVVLGP